MEEDRIMEYRRLGKSGLQVSALALGAGFKYGDQLGEGEVRQCMVGRAIPNNSTETCHC
jgi:aryl-alcohol dehydrogenase-like predicted oxidoreductase